ncbi:DMT family transporter [Paraferrimonas sp. SM1919]|uniref:DMT family transporter n=1 Tax=Paraferrimonas sp. SM1919 TaxID=2662263 RepID=UPI0013D069C6|nr:DMT family transporter [Paraferrimonas sp. SM1919]
MPVAISFITVLLIWSTTPLGIVWSSVSIHPTLAVGLRMALALLLGGLLLPLFRIRLPLHQQAWSLYFFSALGIVGGMMFAYSAATMVSSGIMSLVFGFAPLLAGVMSWVILGQNPFTPMKAGGLLICILGLAVVCFSEVQAGSQIGLGLVLLFGGVFMFSLSSVLVKKVSMAIHPLANTVGALLLSTPCFFLFAYLQGAPFEPQLWQPQSLFAVIYLAVFGSLLGFVAYFHALQKLQPTTVALVNIITPVFSMALGTMLNDEVLQQQTLVGAVIILSGLSLYLFSRSSKSLQHQSK